MPREAVYVCVCVCPAFVQSCCLPLLLCSCREAAVLNDLAFPRKQKTTAVASIQAKQTMESGEERVTMRLCKEKERVFFPLQLIVRNTQRARPRTFSKTSFLSDVMAVDVHLSWSKYTKAVRQMDFCVSERKIHAFENPNGCAMKPSVSALDYTQLLFPSCVRFFFFLNLLLM